MRTRPHACRVSLCEDPNLQELERYPELESAMIDTSRKMIADLTTPLLGAFVFLAATARQLPGDS